MRLVLNSKILFHNLDQMPKDKAPMPFAISLMEKSLK
jgi:hypothetical protein